MVVQIVFNFKDRKFSQHFRNSLFYFGFISGLFKKKNNKPKPQEKTATMQAIDSYATAYVDV